ncbi:MAG: T9SS type A sorting domain-containing protein [Bacteroidetes bacterium]|nr:MAG: T9SS type A sorting domain-containing protein [Bacteroidota bacterium]
MPDLIFRAEQVVNSLNPTNIVLTSHRFFFRKLAFFLFILIAGSTFRVAAQPFILSSVQTDIVNLSYGSISVADINGDGQMDVLFTGNSKSSMPFRPSAAVAINLSSGGAQESWVRFDISELATKTYLGDAFWSDVDLDGDLDFLLTGTTATEPPYTSVTELYINNGTGFVVSDPGLPGVHASIIRWADFDNDGDEDLFLAGETSGGISVAGLYRNDGTGGFSEIMGPSMLARFGDAAFGDYDNDSDLDLIVTGTRIDGSFSTVLYDNNGRGEFTDSGQQLRGFAFAALEFADYDNDGDLDLFLSGAELAVADIMHGKTVLYKNNGGSFVEAPDVFDGVFYGDLTLGDYDLDGDLDLFVMGLTSLNGSHAGRMYRNDNGQFIESTGLVGASTANAEWIDFDGDNDLDILVAGLNLAGIPYTRLIRNISRLVNRPPVAPTGLSTTVDTDDVTFAWLAAEDEESAAVSLTYNVYIGTAPGLSDIFSSRANTSTGKRYTGGPGNTGQNLSWTIYDIPLGVYYWSVQAIDNSFVGSEFAAEGQFSVLTSGKVITDTESDGTLPSDILLKPAYPNPLRTSTIIEYDIPGSTSIEISIYDLLGKRVTTLVKTFVQGGTHRVVWDGTSSTGAPVGAGVYFVRMFAGDASMSQKLVLLK